MYVGSGMHVNRGTCGGQDQMWVCCQSRRALSHVSGRYFMPAGCSVCGWTLQ